MTERGLLQELQDLEPEMVMFIRRHDGGYSVHVRHKGSPPKPYHVANEKTLEGALSAVLSKDEEIEALL